jgi:hypothetical protein
MTFTRFTLAILLILSIMDSSIPDRKRNKDLLENLQVRECQLIKKNSYKYHYFNATVL